MAKSPTTVAAILTLAFVLAGCTPESPAVDPTPSDTPAESTPATPDPTPTEEAAEPADDDPLPPGFPDPNSLIGQEAYDQQDADDDWHTVVGGQPLDLFHAFSSCFDGGAGDVCAYSISGSAPRGADGSLFAPTDATLLMLLRATGMLPDGTPTWVVLDAIITRPPTSEPAFLDACDGTPSVAIYPDTDAPPAPTVPVLAAWGPNADVSAFVEVDPASITCAYIGS